MQDFKQTGANPLGKHHPDSIIWSVTLCEPTALQRRKAQTVRDGASSHSIYYVAQA